MFKMLVLTVLGWWGTIFSFMCLDYIIDGTTSFYDDESRFGFILLIFVATILGAELDKYDENEYMKRLGLRQ